MNGASVYFVSSMSALPGFDVNSPVNSVPGNGHHRGNHFIAQYMGVASNRQEEAIASSWNLPNEKRLS